MNIIMEDWDKPFPVPVNEYNQFTLKLGGEEHHFQIQKGNWESSRLGDMWRTKSTHYHVTAERIHKLTVKTKEQIAAEESVAKAKEALKAAENALKTIKEKK